MIIHSLPTEDKSKAFVSAGLVFSENEEVDYSSSECKEFRDDRIGKLNNRGRREGEWERVGKQVGGFWQLCRGEITEYRQRIV